METESSQDQEASESIEDFKEDIENDPSTASPSEKDDTDLDRLRGG
jgi:hypothetical protein